MTARVLFRELLCGGCLALAMFSAPAFAITHTWQGTSSAMNVGANWLGGLPVSGSSNLTLVFPASPGVNILDQNIASPLEVQSLQFSDAYSVYATSPFQMKNLGAAPTITLGGANNASLGFGIPINFANPTTITTTGSNYKQIGFDQMTGANVTFEGLNTGGNNFTFGGSGNTLTGTNVIKTATATLQSGGAALGGNVTFDAATVQTNIGNQFAAGTNLTMINGSSLNMNGLSSQVNDLTMNSGSLIALLGAETLTINGPITSSSGNNSVGYGYTGTSVDFAGQFKTVDITSTGSGEKLRIVDRIVNGSINKIGAGKLEVGNAANTFTGTNLVAAGTLIGGPQSIGTVTNNATVELNAFGTLAANQISGPGQVIIAGAGVTYVGAQSYTGGTFFNGGLAAGDASTLVGNFTGLIGGNLQFTQNTNALWTGNLSGIASLSQIGTGVLSLGGSNPYTQGTFVQNGGLDIQSDTAIGTGQLYVFSASLRATGTRLVGNQFYPNSTTFEGSGNFVFSDTTAKGGVGDTTHNSSGSTDIAGIWTNGGGTLTVNAGTLAIGNANVVNGFTSTGPIIVNGGTLTVRSRNFISLPTVTLAGGTLNAPNGYAVPLGAVLQGNGGVTGRVATANGSTIIATGNMTIGDGAHLAGVNLDGELYTGDNAVTLNDANQAVLGSFTNLGFTVPGTLNATNGLVLNFGRNLTGWGNVNSTNALAQAVIANGDVQGDSFTNFLDFSGYVKGVGTFNNVAFSGTFSPGLSPALVDVGSAILKEGSVLEMELGGTNRGGQYDALDIAGQLALSGTLKVSLLGAFAPAAGMEFKLFDGVTTGSFDSYALPALGSGLSWDASALTTDGVLAVVVGGIPGDYNGDGSVDAADYSTYRDASATGSLLANDNTPGTVSLADYNVWRSNFGLSAGGSVAASAAVPEPGTLAHFAILLCFFTSRSLFSSRTPTQM